jgi:hypothetical protein
MNSEIQLTALLVQAAMLLREARIARTYQLKSLAMTQEEAAKRKPLDQSTKDWLLEKCAREIADIDELLCSVDKMCFSEKCNATETQATTQELNEKEKRVIAFILSNDKLMNKLDNMSQANHDNVKHPSTD